MRKLNTTVALALGALATAPAGAQTTATPAPAPTAEAAAPMAPVCELHIWPAAKVSASTQGAGASFGLIGVLIDSSAHAGQNKRDQAFITAALDTGAQAKALRDIDLVALLHLPPSTVIVHDQGIDLKTDDAKRISDSTAQCYAEFVVRGLSYIKGMAYKGQMRTFLSIRKFDGAVVKTDFRDSKHDNLEVKLPKDGEDTGPATDALISAFKFDVTFFADKFSKKKA